METATEEICAFIIKLLGHQLNKWCHGLFVFVVFHTASQRGTTRFFSEINTLISQRNAQYLKTVKVLKVKGLIKCQRLKV